MPQAAGCRSGVGRSFGHMTTPLAQGNMPDGSHRRKTERKQRKEQKNLT